MAYLLDSDVLIRAKNDHYGFDLCPGFWVWLERANESSIVHSVEAVYNEIVVGGDELAEWARNHRGSSCHRPRARSPLLGRSIGGRMTPLSTIQPPKQSSPGRQTRF
jgi:hypothetical protein